MSDDIRLAALLAEDVRNVRESCGAFFPKRAGSDFAVIDLRRERNAGKGFVFSERACAEFSRELPEPKRGVETCRRIHKVFCAGRHEFPARANESFELGENGLEIHRVAAVFP